VNGVTASTTDVLSDPFREVWTQPGHRDARCERRVHEINAGFKNVREDDRGLMPSELTYPGSGIDLDVASATTH
jgi:hypothetical protein